MNFPNLLIVGAAKSGTTSLFNYLSQHPDIFMSSNKEPHFLINKEIGSGRIPNGINDLEKYTELFKDGGSFKFRGEASTMYLQFADASIKNIKKYLCSKTKIIIMLRNPIDRAFSGYHHVRRFNKIENLSFEDAIDICEERYTKNLNITPASRYLNIGLYSKMVSKYLNEFKENVHIIIYDDFILDTNSELQKVYNFLSVEDFEVNIKERFMVGGWQWNNAILKNIFLSKGILKRFIKFVLASSTLRGFIKNIFINSQISDTDAMQTSTRKNLLKFYHDDIIKLSEIVSLDLKKWLK
jgi:hypothetical protein